MQANIQKSKYNFLFFVAWLVVSFYLILRTYFVDITDDEAWSYFNVKHFWWVETLCSGNTHWFNFLAIKASLLLGCEKAWQLRWFSLLSGITFLYVGYLWIKSLDNLVIKLLAFSLLFLNPYVIEYLTLARGYSAALCFMALSLYFYTTTDRKIVMSLSLFFAGCSAVANFNFFYFFVPFAAIYFHRHYFQNRFEFLKNKQFYIDGLYGLGVAFLVLRALAFIKECSNDIGSFGGDDLVTSVFCSFIDTLIYGQFIIPTILKYSLGCGLLIFVMIASVYGLVTYKRHANSLYYYSSFILLGMLFLVVFNHWIFHVLYPTERTALMFYPLIVIVLVSFFNYISINTILKNSMLYLVSILLVINFSVNAKIVSGYDHSYCMNTNQYFEYLGSIKAKKVCLGVDVYFIYLKYYQYTIAPFYAESINEYKTNPKYLFNHQLQDFDYLLLLPPYNLSYYKKSSIRLKALKYFPNTKALIVKVEKKQ
ncbi:MAG: hypothetical protein KAZ71_02950 [Bacteroidia bacterium]|nr:hypothetical protein [Bacteroidia bacterium]